MACGSGIDVEEVEVVVVHDFEDVAVSADEDVGALGEEELFDAGLVVAGIASDMGHDDFEVFAMEDVDFGVLVVHGGVVDIAPYGS